MKLNDLNLDYVKKYLSVDHELDDLRIQAHINTAINYIKLSHGRDYSDCSIERGIFKGNVNQVQSIYVKVEEVL